MRLLPSLVLALLLILPAPARAVDPPYQAEMQRLVEILGSLYFLEPLCRPRPTADWRAEASDLIARDQPDDDRRQRLNGAFNQGYLAYARLYKLCTVSANLALSRLLGEAEQLARDIEGKFAE